MKNRSRLLVSMIAATASTLALLPPLSAQEITFTFHPPDSITFLQTLTTTKNTDMGQRGKLDEVTEVVGRLTIMKTSNGYRMTETPLSISATKNGQRVDDPTLALFENIVVEYQLDKDGNLLGISGYEKLVDVMKQLVPAEMLETLSSILNDETLRNRDAAEWNERIGDFIGKMIRLGDSWAGVDSFPLPNGETIAYYSLTRFPEQVKCGNRDCLRLQFDYNSDASALSKLVNRDLAKLLGQPAESLPPTSSAAKISGFGERLVDPHTMLIYSETVERTLTAKTTMPGQGDVDMTQTERREYKYDYSY